MWFLPHPVLFLEVVGDFLFTNHIDKVDDRRSPLHEYKRDETVSATEIQKPFESASSSIVHRSEPVSENQKPIESTSSSIVHRSEPVSENQKPIEFTSSSIVHRSEPVSENQKPIESTSSSIVHHHEIAKPVERAQSSRQQESRVPYAYHVERIPYEPDDTPIGIQYSNRTLPDFGVNATNCIISYHPY